MSEYLKIFLQYKSDHFGGRFFYLCRMATHGNLLESLGDSFHHHINIAMKRLFILIPCISAWFSFHIVHAQLVQQWQSMSSMYGINAIASSENIVYAATKGGLFSYATKTGEQHYWRVSDSTLLTSTLSAMQLDNQTGLIWIGAENGSIMVYDPRLHAWSGITSLSTSQMQGIASKRITSFAFHKGITYCAGDFGIATFSGKIPRDWIKFIGTIPVGTAITSLVIMQDTMWVGTEKGLAKASTTATLQDISSWKVVSSLPVMSLLANNDTIFIAEQDALKCITHGKTTELDIAGRTGLNGLSLHNGSLYYGNENGVYAYPSNQEVKSLVNLGHHRLSDGTFMAKLKNGGLGYVHAGTIDTILPNTPAGNKYSALAVDALSNLWVCMDEGYVGVYDRKDWKNFTRADIFGSRAFPTSRFIGVTPMLNGGMWIGSFGNGFAQGFSNGERITFTPMDDEARKNLAINAGDFTVSGKVAEDRDESIWIPRLTTGTDGPLIVKKNADGTYAPYQGNARSKKFTIAEIDNNRTVWLGAPTYNTGDGNIYYFNQKNTPDNENDDMRGELSIGGINVIKKDASGFMWFGTSSGLNVIFSPGNAVTGRPINVISINALKGQVVNDIAIDAINQKWIATENGLFVLSEDGADLVATFTSRNTIFQSSLIKTVAIDKATGIVYVGTDEGLYSGQTSIVNPAPDYSAIRCFPQPFKPEIHQSVTIEGLSEQSGVSIVTPSGMPIRHLTSQSGRIIWDGRNDQGELVGSGVYLILAQSGNLDQSGIAKCMVLRK
jgi:ligand-binding sensor domain-containing protein